MIVISHPGRDLCVQVLDKKAADASQVLHSLATARYDKSDVGSKTINVPELERFKWLALALIFFLWEKTKGIVLTTSRSGCGWQIQIRFRDTFISYLNPIWTATICSSTEVAKLGKRRCNVMRCDALCRKVIQPPED